MHNYYALPKKKNVKKIKSFDMFQNETIAQEFHQVTCNQWRTLSVL